MTFLKNIAVALFIAAFALDLPTETEGNPYVISDDRVRSLDVTPVLGRGYSIMTNSFQSTCLDVEDITIPSFNYDYSFYEFSGSDDIMQDLAESLAESFAYGPLKNEFEKEYGTDSGETSSVFIILASMRIERYYASVKDSASSISTTAMTLLENQDYIGFFKACGPNYVRGIRRAQEVTAMFKFESASTEGAASFAKSLQTTKRQDGPVNPNAAPSSLTIKISGYGLALSEDGSETLMATTLDQFNGVMSFAYNTMTKHPDAHHIGMVFGIEVVPWVENSLFQVAANVQGQDIEIPIARSLIPRAYNRTNPDDMDFDKNEMNARIDFKCKVPGHLIDKYGYCCEALSMYDFAAEEYNADDLDERVCRPIRSLDKVFVKENMAGNGEFVARLDRALRYKTNTMAVLQKCISSVRGLPSTVDDNYLVSHADRFSVSAVKLTVLDMKTAMDPFSDYSMVKHMGREIDEFISMYYSPCLNALFGANAGTSTETDSSYFMAYAWHTHQECSYMSCLASGMRWDRVQGGCVPGLMSGPSAPNYPDGEDGAKCAFDENAGGDTQSCKYTAADLNEYQDSLKACWGNSTTLSAGFSVETYLNSYCMPVVSSEKMPADEFAALKASIPSDCGGEEAASSSDVRTLPANYNRLSANARAKLFMENKVKEYAKKQREQDTVVVTKKTPPRRTEESYVDVEAPTRSTGDM